MHLITEAELSKCVVTPHPECPLRNSSTRKCSALTIKHHILPRPHAGAESDDTNGIGARTNTLHARVGNADVPVEGFVEFSGVVVAVEDIEADTSISRA